jgi:hypothetical protein
MKNMFGLALFLVCTGQVFAQEFYACYPQGKVKSRYKLNYFNKILYQEELEALIPDQKYESKVRMFDLRVRHLVYKPGYIWLRQFSNPETPNQFMYRVKGVSDIPLNFIIETDPLMLMDDGKIKEFYLRSTHSEYNHYICRLLKKYY